MHNFTFTSYAQHVIFGPDSITSLGKAVEQCGWHRLLLVTSKSQRRNGSVAKVADALGERLIASFEGALAHVPAEQVNQVTALAEQHEVDAIIGLGGGSSLGLAKTTSFTIELKRSTSGQNSPSNRIVSPLSQPLVPVIAIPTTYAGSEMTPVCGMTSMVEGVTRKQTTNDPRVAPRLVLYDPQLTLDLPPEVTAATGINALAHCVEALYSRTRNPVSTTSALGGLRAIMLTLPRCYAHGDDADARCQLLQGAYLAGSALAHVSMALHHGLCHVLGGSAGVPHGVANAIILPHAMRFNLDATAPRLAQAAQVLGLTAPNDEQATRKLIDLVETLISNLNLPQRLRDVGIAREDLPRLAELAFQNRTVQSNPKPITSVAQMETLLQAAW